MMKTATNPTKMWLWALLFLLRTAAVAAAFQLPADFFENKCDPCISRTESVIRVMVSGDDDDWDYIQSAMEQASRDTGIHLEFALYQDSYEAMAADIQDLAAQKTVDALIVALPAQVATLVEDAVKDALDAGLPVFGYGAGYRTAPDVGFLGFVAQDHFVAGQIVGEELLKRLDTNGNEHQEDPQDATMEKKELKAMFVTRGNSEEDAGVKDRFLGIQSVFDQFMLQDNDGGVLIIVDTNTSTSTTSEVQSQAPFQIEWQAASLKTNQNQEQEGTALTTKAGTTTFTEVSSQDIFLDCPDVVVADDPLTAEAVLTALEESGDIHGCSNETDVLIATFGVSPAIHSAILQHTVAFAAVPQLYLQSVFAVVMASVFVTTGKKLALPIDSNEIYLSGPSIYALDDKDRLPENSITKCKELAFPICDPESSGELAPFDSPILSSPLALAPSLGSRTCNAQGCLNRKSIRLAGVLHGVTTSNFWKPIYASAHKVAQDLGVSLEMAPFEPTQNPGIMWDKMGARIRSLCADGVDGLIVTIPDEALLDAIRYCQGKEVPIVSINSGADFSKELGLLVHIGQMEYNAGYGAGERLVGLGMKEGYCMIHNLGNIALQSRCKGFEDAIAKHDGVVYHGLVEVSGDDVARSVLAVESAFEDSGSTSWEGVALLSLSMSLADAALDLYDKHPEVMLATFDFGDPLYEPLNDGRFKFAIDQQSLLQGMIPVYLLTYAAYSKQSLVNQVVETGPHFVDAPPSIDQQICEGHYYNTCADIPVEDRNKLPQELVGIGYFLVALTLVAAGFCVGWTKYYWTKSELVHVSQPPFLFALAAGIVISTISILFMSVEADYPTKISTLTGHLTDEASSGIGKANAACMAVPWLHSVGSVIVFASLFGKIWRIKLVFQAGTRFRRVKVGVKDVLPYAMVLLAVVLGLLIAWQVADPFVWKREVQVANSEGLPLESYGECTSDTGWYYWLALLSFQLVYLLYALVLCWQTRAIPTSFAEGNHVSLCVVCIFQVSLLAIPITAMVRDDTAAYYFVRACAVFLQNFTVLCLIFGPKMWLVYKGEDKLQIRPSLATTNPRTSYMRQNWDETPQALGQPRADLRSENAKLKLHILDLESVGKASLPPELDAVKEELRKQVLPAVSETERTSSNNKDTMPISSNVDSMPARSNNKDSIQRSFNTESMPRRSNIYTMPMPASPSKDKGDGKENHSTEELTEELQKRPST